MAYVRRFNDKVMQVEDYTDQAALQAAINGLQPSAFKWEISKWMPKNLSSLMEETQKHTIVEALYYIGDTSPSKPEALKNEGGSSGAPPAKTTQVSPRQGKEKWVQMIQASDSHPKGNTELDRGTEYLQETQFPKVRHL